MPKVKGRPINSEDLENYIKCMDENFICDELYFQGTIPLNDFLKTIERIKFIYDARRYFRKENNIDYFIEDEAIYINTIQIPEYKSIDTDLVVSNYPDLELDKAYYIVGKEYKEDQTIVYPFPSIPVDIGPEGIFECLE